MNVTAQIERKSRTIKFDFERAQEKHILEI